MELEEAIKILENFKNNKLERDKLEIRYHGGFKIGDIHKFTELNPAIETILNHLTKQEKMIDRMAKALHLFIWKNDEKIMITSRPKVSCHNLSIEEIKQYFEKIAEESE